MSVSYVCYRIGRVMFKLVGTCHEGEVILEIGRDGWFWSSGVSGDLKRSVTDGDGDVSERPPLATSSLSSSRHTTVVASRSKR